MRTRPDLPQPRSARTAAVVIGAFVGASILVACGDSSSTVSAPTTSGDPGIASSAIAETAPSSPPATGPDSSTAVPSGFPGSSEASTAGLTAKQKNIIAQMRTVGVQAPDDVILQAVEYVCTQKNVPADNTNLKTFVTAMVGAGTNNEGAAEVQATKLIAAARSGYCE